MLLLLLLFVVKRVYLQLIKQIQDYHFLPSSRNSLVRPIRTHVELTRKEPLPIRRHTEVNDEEEKKNWEAHQFFIYENQ